MKALDVDFFSTTMGRKPRTENSDRTIETNEAIHDHFWGRDSSGAWTVSLKFVGNRPFCQLDIQHLPPAKFYSLVGYCYINHIPTLIDDPSGLFDLDPRHPYGGGL